MKLSSLNKFKNRTVSVVFMDSDRKHDPDWNGICSTTQGLLEEVDETFITIASEDGLMRIKIKDIRELWDKEKTKEIEERERKEREKKDKA